jgi:oxepin-CoA hydrolase/3-oxo-5,6-dehydrosuberyl-CoA semialdehyde dehydrogenase
MTVKAGQKCTAIRRVLVPQAWMSSVREDLVELLGQIRVGDPKNEDVRMGPLASRAQLADVREGVERLGGRHPFGSPAPIGERGFFVSPILVEDPADIVHEREVFGPVASLLRYKDDPAGIVTRGAGGLVASLYSDDQEFVERMVGALAPYHGRLFLGHPKIELSPGPGTVLPQLVHGGPGRAGGGEELGGPRGLAFYMQRVALEGSRPVIQKLLGK